MSDVTYLRQRWIRMIQSGEIIHCAICGYPVPIKAKGKSRIARGGKGSITVDHVIPKAWGGTDDIGNLQPAHQLCNQNKGSKHPLVV